MPVQAVHSFISQIEIFSPPTTCNVNQLAHQESKRAKWIQVTSFFYTGSLPNACRQSANRLPQDDNNPAFYSKSKFISHFSFLEKTVNIKLCLSYWCSFIGRNLHLYGCETWACTTRRDILIACLARKCWTEHSELPGCYKGTGGKMQCEEFKNCSLPQTAYIKHIRQSEQRGIYQAWGKF